MEATDETSVVEATQAALRERERAEHGTSVFQYTAEHGYDPIVTGDGDDEPWEIGRWYWWSCMPGCLPDSDPHGPFDTEVEATADMRDDYELPVIVTIENVDGDVWSEEGTLAEDDDESGERAVVVYCDAVDAYRDRTIEGSSWEHAGDGVYYTILHVMNTDDRLDVLTARLTEAGYRVLHGRELCSAWTQPPSIGERVRRG